MDGIVALWKERGMTSHDCVFQIRKLFKTKRVGHTGTLDPNVSGVLPICIGKATKIAEYMTNAGKTYEGEVTIGLSTTTEDADGETVEVKKVDKTFSRKEILDVFERLTGTIEQTPPMFSAVKVNGKRLYEYARQGLEVERPKRTVTIYELELLDNREWFSGEFVSIPFRVVCSKGTYIRTLAVMIGQELGYPAHMSKLTRTASGGFSKTDCVTLSDLSKLAEKNQLETILFPLEQGVSHLPKWNISDKVAEKVKNGAILEKPIDWPENDGKVAVFYKNRLMAIYQTHPTKQLYIKPVKVLTE